MSWLISGRVKNLKVGDSTAKFILLVLSDYANAETGECFPSLNTLAEKCEVHRATVVRKLDFLEEHTFILRKKRHNNSTVYTILLNKEGVAECDRGVAECDPNLSLNQVNKKYKGEVPEDWKPSEELKLSINEKLGEIKHDYETNKFVDHHISKGTKFKRIDRAYQLWCRNSIEFRRPTKSNSISQNKNSFNGSNNKPSIFDRIHNEYSTKN